MQVKPWFATYGANNIPATINADAHRSVVHMLETAMKLFALKAPGATLTGEELIADCSKQMTDYKVPKTVLFVDALLKSTIGKILRRELRTVV